MVNQTQIVNESHVTLTRLCVKHNLGTEFVQGLRLVIDSEVLVHGHRHGLLVLLPIHGTGDNLVCAHKARPDNQPLHEFLGGHFEGIDGRLLPVLGRFLSHLQGEGCLTDRRASRQYD